MLSSWQPAVRLGERANAHVHLYFHDCLPCSWPCCPKGHPTTSHDLEEYACSTSPPGSAGYLLPPGSGPAGRPSIRQQQQLPLLLGPEAGAGTAGPAAPEITPASSSADLAGAAAALHAPASWQITPGRRPAHAPTCAALQTGLKVQGLTGVPPPTQRMRR
jgi:hypothetical protein